MVHCVTISLFSAGRQFKERLPRVCLPLPFPLLTAYRRSVQLLFVLHPWRVLYTDASYQSDESWLPRHRADINRRQ